MDCARTSPALPARATVPAHSSVLVARVYPAPATGGLGLRLEHLARRTGDFTAPAHACATWRLLYLLCRKLNSELRERMALETAALLGRDIRESTEDSGCSAAM